MKWLDHQTALSQGFTKLVWKTDFQPSSRLTSVYSLFLILGFGIVEKNHSYICFEEFSLFQKKKLFENLQVFYITLSYKKISVCILPVWCEIAFTW
jgi:hypothetical protein